MKRVMVLNLKIIIPTEPVQGVEAETVLDIPPEGHPDSISRKLLDFRKEDWVSLFERSADGTVVVRRDVDVFFRARRYKFSSGPEADGTFQIKRDW
jgi:hypothetical protein